MSNRDKQIGENVRRIRGERSQQWLADEMTKLGHEKWSQSTVWAVEKGTRPLRLAEANDLAALFNLPMLERLIETRDEWRLDRAELLLFRKLNQLREAMVNALEEQEKFRAVFMDPDLDHSSIAPAVLERASISLEDDMVVKYVERQFRQVKAGEEPQVP